MQILLVEDNADLAANIGEYLEGLGHVVDYAADGLSGLHLSATHSYDAVVLDLMLPGLDGMTLCRRLREDGRSEVPVLMLTARDTEADTLAGFEAGADDYMSKPFSLPELAARLQAVHRRGRSAGPVLRVADLEFDTRTLIARRGTRRLALTPIGRRILEQLMRASPQVVLRARLEEHVWNEHPPHSDAALRVHIRALRQAIGTEPPLLHTVHGAGYRLARDDDG